MINPLLVQIRTSDGLTLPGLFYEAYKSKKAMIYLHGNGSTSAFYYDDLREILARELNKNGVSFLPFNNRGAHYIKKLDIKKNGKIEKKLYGTAFEEIKKCIMDIDAVINLLEKRGYREFYLIGESTGANKICVYSFYKPNNKVSKYVLIGGGDDTGIYYNLLGEENFLELLEESREKLKNGEGDRLIPELVLQNNFLSYRAFYDTANPDGDYNVFPFLEEFEGLKLSKKSLFRHFMSINKPALVVYGEKDEYAWGKVSEIVELLKKQKPKLEYKIIKDGDHSLSQHQKELANIIVNFLTK